jgi:hypothetical protein
MWAGSYGCDLYSILSDTLPEVADGFQAHPARDRCIIAVIPHKANEKDKPAFFAKTLHKGARPH